MGIFPTDAISAALYVGLEELGSRAGLLMLYHASRKHVCVTPNKLLVSQRWDLGFHHLLYCPHMLLCQTARVLIIGQRVCWLHLYY